MFGESGGEGGEAVPRERDYMSDAQRRWPFLTRYDLATIHSEQLIATIARDRMGHPNDQVADAVRHWMTEKPL